MLNLLNTVTQFSVSDVRRDDCVHGGDDLLHLASSQEVGGGGGEGDAGLQGRSGGGGQRHSHGGRGRGYALNTNCTFIRIHSDSMYIKHIMTTSHKYYRPLSKPVLPKNKHLLGYLPTI